MRDPLTPAEWDREYRALWAAYRAVCRERDRLRTALGAYPPLDAATKARIYQPVHEALVLRRLSEQCADVITDPEARP